MAAFIRCTDSEAAKNLIEKKIWSQAYILEGFYINSLYLLYVDQGDAILSTQCLGEEEKEYWRKIEENRAQKRDKSNRPKKSGAERARQKKDIKRDPETTQNKNTGHIRFDDS